MLLLIVYMTVSRGINRSIRSRSSIIKSFRLNRPLQKKKFVHLVVFFLSFFSTRKPRHTRSLKITFYFRRIFHKKMCMCWTFQKQWFVLDLLARSTHTLFSGSTWSTHWVHMCYWANFLIFQLDILIWTLKKSKATFFVSLTKKKCGHGIYMVLVNLVCLCKLCEKYPIN